jgi:hypothetical protein
VTAQVANERVDLAALSFPFNCEQSHLRTAVGAGNREILNIRSRVVLLAHASDNPSASYARAIARPGIGFQRRKGHAGTFRGNVGRPLAKAIVRVIRTLVGSNIIVREAGRI